MIVFLCSILLMADGVGRRPAMITLHVPGIDTADTQPCTDKHSDKLTTGTCMYTYIGILHVAEYYLGPWEDGAPSADFARGIFKLGSRVFAVHSQSVERTNLIDRARTCMYMWVGGRAYAPGTDLDGLGGALLPFLANLKPRWYFTRKWSAVSYTLARNNISSGVVVYASGCPPIGHCVWGLGLYADLVRTPSHGGSPPPVYIYTYIFIRNHLTLNLITQSNRGKLLCSWKYCPKEAVQVKPP